MLKAVLQRLYDATIREHLPRKIKVYNGVAINFGRLLDTDVVDPDYKQGTIDPLREYTRHDDRVVVIGGGLGVSAVVAAHHGESVVVYEGGVEWADRVRETADLNRVDGTIQVREAIVGDEFDVYGDDHTESRVAPSELPSCEVLEMDCEGAEQPILERLEIEPRIVIVETHPAFGVEPGEIREQLEVRGYDIVNRYELSTGNVTLTGRLGNAED